MQGCGRTLKPAREGDTEELAYGSCWMKRVQTHIHLLGHAEVRLGFPPFLGFWLELNASLCVELTVTCGLKRAVD